MLMDLFPRAHARYASMPSWGHIWTLIDGRRSTMA